jgi:hypothetical protein
MSTEGDITDLKHDIDKLDAQVTTLNGNIELLSKQIADEDSETNKGILLILHQRTLEKERLILEKERQITEIRRVMRKRNQVL